MAAACTTDRPATAATTAAAPAIFLRRISNVMATKGDVYGEWWPAGEDMVVDAAAVAAVVVAVVVVVPQAYWLGSNMMAWLFPAVATALMVVAVVIVLSKPLYVSFCPNCLVSGWCCC